MPKKSSNNNGYESIPFRMHPRVFAALGADLVTNDVVAVIELVKNSYDAYADKVWVRFGHDPSEGDFLEIEDNGQGMKKNIIEDVWCLVATPYKENNPIVTSGKKTRRVAGEKGLGRLSAARLGDRMRMLTKAPNSTCWEVGVTWSAISTGDDLSASYAKCRKYPGKPSFKKSGTIIRIYDLAGQWDENRISDLEQNLARLISPFSEQMGEFKIFLCRPDAPESDEVEIETPRFLETPKYLIKGTVSAIGNIRCKYQYTSVTNKKGRTENLSLKWQQVYDGIQDGEGHPFDHEKSNCGPFSFEIRAWDIGSDDTQEISDRYGLQKSEVRKAIRMHKGISVYRDGVLVLPKTDRARDWLGLDLRRISKVGTRLSTSQIVGHVSISADKNKKIEDTSDREKLASTIEVMEFEEILKAIVALLENERDIDRVRPEIEKPLEDIFEHLNAEDMIAEVVALAEEGAEASEAIPILRAFSSSLDEARKTIQKRFIFYSRMATVGVISHMLVHEIRNRTTAFGSFLDFIKSRFGPFNDEVQEEYRFADEATDALERLADTFSPLASRAFNRRNRFSILEERIGDCLILHRGDINVKGIKCSVPNTKTAVAVDPGELDAILINLISNAIYWLNEVGKEDRKITFKLEPIHEEARIRVWIHDTGCGIKNDIVEKVFWPGVTRKLGGIGMGLTVASELVAEYGGKMTTCHPGKMGGASFAFDLPLKTQSQREIGRK